MGTYCKLVNVTKHEQYEPENIKPSGFKFSADQIVALLIGRWRGDEVRFVTDSEDGGLWDRVGDDEERGVPWPNVFDPDWEKK